MVNNNWLLVYLPLWKIWVRQWEGWQAIYEMENNPNVPNHQPDKITRILYIMYNIISYYITLCVIIIVYIYNVIYTIDLFRWKRFDHISIQVLDWSLREPWISMQVWNLGKFQKLGNTTKSFLAAFLSWISFYMCLPEIGEMYPKGKIWVHTQFTNQLLNPTCKAFTTKH